MHIEEISTRIVVMGVWAVGSCGVSICLSFEES